MFADIMEKVIDFYNSLSPLLREILENPTIKIRSDYVELCFNVIATIRDPSIFILKGYDEFLMYPSTLSHSITVVYVFYNNE